MNEHKQQKIDLIKKLSTNLSKFTILNGTEQNVLIDALHESQSNVERLVPSGVWHPMHCKTLDENRRYRLSSKFAERKINEIKASKPEPELKSEKCKEVNIYITCNIYCNRPLEAAEINIHVL